jgi:predicted unusual protein kinase regulating ubiquinone biosynthesis (AarF/ABC1/UbiB family)
MASAVEADLGQLGMILSLQRRMSPEIDTSEIAKEMTERLREELDYRREAKHAALYASMLADEPLVRVPEIDNDLSTTRLLTMGWLDGRRILEFVEAPLEDRNRIATAMFRAWWNPFARFGVIHGDPHLGNYTVFEEPVKKGAGRRPSGINLLDFGCIRIFPPRFVAGVIDLYEGLRANERARIVHAYESWGFRNLGNEMIDALSIWARFIYAPLLDDRVRTIADGVAPHAYGRREAWEVKQKLKPLGSVLIPREFVLMDRAAVGLGSVMLHLKAELNFHRLFAEAVQDFSETKLAAAQQAALKRVGLE